mgnify:FL=1
MSVSFCLLSQLVLAPGHPYWEFYGIYAHLGNKYPVLPTWERLSTFPADEQKWKVFLKSALSRFLLVRFNMTYLVFGVGGKISKNDLELEQIFVEKVRGILYSPQYMQNGFVG